MTKPFSVAELEAYLDEALPSRTMAEIENALRADPDLVMRLSELIKRRDVGIHSLGAFWRRGRLSCPSREQLGSYLLGALGQDVAGYITFHLQIAGCRYCAANVADLKAKQAESETEVEGRRQRYFHSSAGYLRRHV